MEISTQSKTYYDNGNIRYSCQYHVLFCTKYRRKVLTEEIIIRLRELMAEKEEEYGYHILAVEVTADHVHLMLEIQPVQSVCQVVGRIKAHTSHVLREQYGELRSRIPTLWTRASMISSVGNVSLNDIEMFLDEQKKR